LIDKVIHLFWAIAAHTNKNSAITGMANRG